MGNKYLILFRKDYNTEKEFSVAKEFFPTIERRSLLEISCDRICAVADNAIIIPRYSALPFYKELEDDVLAVHARLINNYGQHQYIATFDWYHTLKCYTPYTWFKLQDVLNSDYQGPYVLKGATNSRKNLWNTHMYAANKDELKNVYFRLIDDSLIGTQDIIFREYVPLLSLGSVIAGPPLTYEFRYFVLNNRIVGKGFYWSQHYDTIKTLLPAMHDQIEEERFDNFVYHIIDRLDSRINFFVVDVAKTLDNQLIVIELNDGSMSGLSTINARDLYDNMRKELFK